MLISGSIEQLEGVENIVLWGADAGLQAAAQNAIARVHAAASPSAFGGIGTPADATGNDLANTITGNALANHLAGGAGNDTMTGGLGNDTLDGGSGVDSLTGGLGDDEYFLEASGVAVEEADGGYDVLNSFTIESLDGYDHFEGLRYLGANAVDLHRGSTNTSNDVLGGGSGNDTVRGYGGDDTLGGGGGDDTINGGVGADELYGGAGWDDLDGGSGNDLVDGGDGDDVARGGADNDEVNGGDGSDYAFGGGGTDLLTGGAGLDQVYGETGDDDLDGGSGDDSVSGGEGNDRVVGGTGDDLVYGDSQTYSGSGLVAAGDVLWGDEVAGDGTGGVDTFIFHTLTADNGVHETFNGSGVYAFNTGALIADFAAGTDLIGIASSLVGNGDAVFDSVQIMESAGNFDADAELVIFRTDMSGTLSFTDVLAPFEAAAVDAVVDNPDAAIGVNVTKLFVVDNGTDSAVFLFQSNNGDAAVTIDELFLMDVVKGQPELTQADFLLS
jgi:Ca2+-binding RTX toxin-like protein